jgi:biotin carboxylase
VAPAIKDNAMKTILLLGAGTGATDAVVRLKRLGLIIIMAELAQVFDFKKCEKADEIIVTDYRKPDFIGFALKLREAWPFDAALSITEAGVAVAARINELIGVRGSNPRAIAYLNDKAAMRRLLNEQGFSEVQYQVIRDPADVEAFAATAGFPFIIKPVDGGGSDGIYLVRNHEEAKSAVHELEARHITPLAERYIDGKEYSVESFSFDGRHTIVAITEKLVNDRFVEIGHVVPARIDAPTAAAVADFVRRFLRIIGVTNGPCHTEIKIGLCGMKIIESHNRVGGGHIPRLVELTYGVDLISLAGQWACGLIEPSLPATSPDGAAAIHFFIFPAGKISAIEGIDQVHRNARTVEYRCLYQEGDTVPPLSSNSSRAGYVIVRDDTPDDAIERSTQLARAVVASVE